MAKTRKRTPKERVLARRPDADCVFHSGIFYFTVNRFDTNGRRRKELGRGSTTASAWADAARRLQQEKGK